MQMAAVYAGTGESAEDHDRVLAACLQAVSPSVSVNGAACSRLIPRLVSHALGILIFYLYFKLGHGEIQESLVLFVQP